MFLVSALASSAQQYDFDTTGILIDYTDRKPITQFIESSPHAVVSENILRVITLQGMHCGGGVIKSHDELLVMVTDGNKNIRWLRLPIIFGECGTKIAAATREESYVRVTTSEPFKKEYFVELPK